MLQKVIDVNSPEYYLRDDVPLRNSHDIPNPLNPPPIRRRKAARKRVVNG
jgi:hypothetical protein